MEDREVVSKFTDKCHITFRDDVEKREEYIKLMLGFKDNISSDEEPVETSILIGEIKFLDRLIKSMDDDMDNLKLQLSEYIDHLKYLNVLIDEDELFKILESSELNDNSDLVKSITNLHCNPIDSLFPAGASPKVKALFFEVEIHALKYNLAKVSKIRFTTANANFVRTKNLIKREYIKQIQEL